MTGQEIITRVDAMKDTIRKHSSVITAAHVVVEGGLTLKPEDLSFFNYLLARVHPYPKQGFIYEIPIKEAMEFMRWDRTAKVHASLDRLCKVNIEIDYEKDGEHHSIRSHYLSHNSSHAESGLLKFAFDAILVQFLPDPKVYGSINVNRSHDLKSMGAKRLYEFGCMNRNKYDTTWRLSVSEFRSISETGDKHPRFDNFRRLVLDKAIEEVNNIADFDIAYETETAGQGGTVSTIVFKILGKSHARLLQATTIKSKSAKSSKNGDQFTVDMLDGKTNEERGGPAELTSDVMDRVTAKILPEDDIEKLIREWRDVTRGLALNDPDKHFESWIDLREIKRNDPVLSGLDEDIFSNFFNGED
jgi:hypothetical protein